MQAGCGGHGVRHAFEASGFGNGEGVSGMIYAHVPRINRLGVRSTLDG